MYNVEQYANALYEVLQGAHPKNHQKVIDNFIKVLAENGDTGLCPKIVEEIKKLEQRRKNVKKVELVTAKPLEVREETKILEELNSYLGENIELKKVVDEGLISGLVIKVDDTVIDGSVKKRIENLKSDLTS